MMDLMDELRELYQDVIIDHSKHPRNFRALEPCSHQADGYNPLCGDRITLYVNVDSDHVVDVSFKGSGCAISTASASLLTEIIKGKTRAEAETLFQKFHDLLMGNAEPDSELGKLAALAGVREFPMRVKCATLAWHTLHTALEGEEDIASTE